MDEQSFNDDVTMGSPYRAVQSQTAAASERSMNDDVTIVDRPGGTRAAFDGGTMNDDRTLVDLPGQNPAGQKSKEFDEPVLAEIDQFALIKKLGEGTAGKVYMAYDRETKLKVAVKGLPILEVPQFLRELPSLRNAPRGFNLFEAIIVLLG